MQRITREQGLSWRESKALLMPRQAIVTKHLAPEPFRFQGIDITPLDPIVVEYFAIGGHAVIHEGQTLEAWRFAGRSAAYIIVPPDASIEIRVRNVSRERVPYAHRLLAAND